MRFAWNRYFPWYFLADLVIWSLIIGGRVKQKELDLVEEAA